MVDLEFAQFRRNQVFLDSIGMNTVVDLGKVPADIPAELLSFFIFKSLEFFYQIKFKLYRNPGGKLKSNIFMGISTPVTSRLGNNPNGVGFFYPLFWRKSETI